MAEAEVEGVGGKRRLATVAVSTYIRGGRGGGGRGERKEAVAGFGRQFSSRSVGVGPTRGSAPEPEGVGSAAENILVWKLLESARLRRGRKGFGGGSAEERTGEGKKGARDERFRSRARQRQDGERDESIFTSSLRTDSH